MTSSIPWPDTDWLHDGCRILMPCIRDELERQDTVHPLFHGSWDWHSAVHGHWALLVGADLLQDTTHIQWVVNRLQSKAMLDEFESLAQTPAFELPYGRAWLLRLLLAYESLTGHTDLRHSAVAIADDLTSWIEETTETPASPEYLNPCWVLLQLHAWSIHIEDEPALEWLNAEVREKYMQPPCSPARDEDSPGTFFSPWGLQTHLIGQTLGSASLDPWLTPPCDEAILEPVAALHSAHHLAIHASRAWGLWEAYRATGQARWLTRHRAHIQAAIDLHTTWQHDRRSYRHWVPQFTIYAIKQALS